MCLSEVVQTGRMGRGGAGRGWPQVAAELPHSPRVADRPGAAIGRGAGCELTVELAEERDAIGEPKLGAGGGQRGVLRGRGAVDDEARAGKRLEYGGKGRIAHPVMRPGEPRAPRAQPR